MTQYIIFHKLHTVDACSNNLFMCPGDLGISTMSPPARQPKAEFKFLPGYVTANQSTPRLAPLSAVSWSTGLMIGTTPWY